MPDCILAKLPRGTRHAHDGYTCTIEGPGPKDVAFGTPGGIAAATLNPPVFPPPRHVSSAMLPKKCSFYKLGGVERWAGRGSAPAPLIRRIFNYLCARTAIDFGSEASEQSTVVHKAVYRNSPHDPRKSGRHSYMQPDQF